MADYPISNVPRRIVYTGSAGIGPYAYDFEILTNTDINVYKNDTLLILTTDYTVSISPTLGTGSVTLVSAAISADRITIVGSRAIQRTSDFTTGGDFFANTLNNEMDSQTILTQQVAETAERSIKAPVTDPTNIDMTLPINTARAGKTLAFDTNGNPVAGDPIGNWRDNWASGTLYQNRDLIKDTTNSNVYLCTVSHTSSGSLPINTNADYSKWALVVDASAADASADAADISEANALAYATLANEWATKTSAPVSGGEYSAKYHAIAASSSSSSASTSATNADNAKIAAESARDATLAAFDSFDDRYLGTKTSNPTLDNDSNALLAGALYFNSVTAVMNVYTGSEWVAAYVSGTGFLTVASNLSDVANTTTARANISAAKSGANSDITSITGLTTPLSVEQGGTGTATPAIIAGTNITVSGSFPNQTINASGGSGLLNNIQYFTATGTYTPTAGTTFVVVELVGGGGGSGGVNNAGGQLAGSGSGGGYARKKILSGFSGVTVTVGNGGAGGAGATSNGSAGGTSSFGAICSATGGAGGPQSSGGASSKIAGAGGTGVSGDINIIGGVGVSIASGGGSWGGSSFYSGYKISISGTGAVGNVFGGGALGGYNANIAGVAGGSGLVIVWEYI